MIIAIDPERFVEVTAQLSAAARKAVAKPSKAQREEVEADGLTWEQVARYRQEDLFKLVGGNQASVASEVFDTLKSDKGVTVLVADETELNPLPESTRVVPLRRAETEDHPAGRRSESSDTPPPVTDRPDEAPVAKTAKATPRPRNK